MIFKSDKKEQNHGDAFEQKARAHLISQGLKLLEQNYACKLGEIDLIMEDNQTIVFVEVRYRQSNRFGGAIESVTKSKQSRIIATAKHWLTRKGLYDKRSVRFDVIAYSNHDQQWIKGAF